MFSKEKKISNGRNFVKTHLCADIKDDFAMTIKYKSVSRHSGLLHKLSYRLIIFTKAHLVKVSKSRKEIMMSLILPKNKQTPLRILS